MLERKVNILKSDPSISYTIADINLYKLGLKEMELSKNEMPGLISIQKKYGSKKPLKNLKITGCLHMTVQTAMLIETLKILGADIRWCSCNIFSTQDHAAAAVVMKGLASVFAWKNQSLYDFWWSIKQALIWPNFTGPDLIIDDGGDATLFVHKGFEYENNPDFFIKENNFLDLKYLLKIFKKIYEIDNNFWKKISSNIIGVSEETTTGVNRLYRLSKKNKLLFPAFNVNDSVTKSKFDNIYGCQESLVDGIKRATDIMLAGKKVVICGYGNVGKGCAKSMSAYGSRVFITEVDPICALQAVMEGFEVVTLEDIVGIGDIFITATGCCNVIRGEHIEKMKNEAIICNIGHFDNEIDIDYLENKKDCNKVNIKPQVDQWILGGDRSVIILAEGRLVNLGCATGHPSFVMSNSFTNQCLAQLELVKRKHKKKVYILPKILDEEVARLHLDRLGSKLTKLKPNQAKYLGLSIDGPFKSDNYRY